MTRVEHKTPNVGNLVKKKDYDAKALHINSRYFTIADYNKFTSQTLDPKIKQKGLVDRFAIAGFTNKTDLDLKSSNIGNKSWIKSKERQNNKIYKHLIQAIFVVKVILNMIVLKII